MTSASLATTGLTRLRLLTVEQEQVEEEGEEYRVVADMVEVPAAPTTYWCTVHKLEEAFRAVHHVLR